MKGFDFIEQKINVSFTSFSHSCFIEASLFWSIPSFLIFHQSVPITAFLVFCELTRVSGIRMPPIRRLVRYKDIEMTFTDSSDDDNDDSLADSIGRLTVNGGEFISTLLSLPVIFSSLIESSIQFSIRVFWFIL